MHITSTAAAAILLIAGTAAHAADNTAVERLMICQDSWLEWKTGNPAQLQAFVGRLLLDFSRRNNTDPFLAPKSSQTVIGLPLTEVFPESVGMGVGFSVLVTATFDSAKASLERRLGRSLARCEPPSDNMRTCELKIAEQKTIVLMAEDNARSTKTLIGCYYLYEK